MCVKRAPIILNLPVHCDRTTWLLCVCMKQKMRLKCRLVVWLQHRSLGHEMRQWNIIKISIKFESEYILPAKIFTKWHLVAKRMVILNYMLNGTQSAFFLKRVKNVCVCNAYDDERRNKYFIALLILAPLTVLYLQMLDTYRHACSYISLAEKNDQRNLPICVCGM